MNTHVEAPRRTFVHTTTIAAPPEAVFPLLCPVREYDWIPTWSCDLLHVPRGAAEEGAVFRTDAPHGRGGMTWVVTRHEPMRAVDFACFADGLIQRLLVRLTPAAGGTDLSWTREHTALDADSARWLAAVDESEVGARTQLLFDRLSHYARTGAALPTPA